MILDMDCVGRELWYKGIVTEASWAVITQLKKNNIPYIAATHDVNNVRRGNVMKRLGMSFHFSYEEQWQLKDVLVTFRMYQLNLNGENKEYVSNTGMLQQCILLKHSSEFEYISPCFPSHALLSGCMLCDNAV